MKTLNVILPSIGQVSYEVDFVLDGLKFSEIELGTVLVNNQKVQITPELTYLLSKHASNYWRNTEEPGLQAAIRQMYEDAPTA